MLFSSHSSLSSPWRRFPREMPQAPGRSPTADSFSVFALAVHSVIFNPRAVAHPKKEQLYNRRSAGGPDAITYRSARQHFFPRGFCSSHGCASPTCCRNYKNCLFSHCTACRTCIRRLVNESPIRVSMRCCRRTVCRYRAIRQLLRLGILSAPREITSRLGRALHCASDLTFCGGFTNWSRSPASVRYRIWWPDDTTPPVHMASSIHQNKGDGGFKS
ncbi:hypothetical protein BS50DRAFT_657606 [Corynespora cassiicola Philippines]|uniref:Uncharacterized protein n=1 Tax=Corynespora cassiicola Philippines TaxID=1448308 RepID=A0A2T2P2I0_CORCC|nr:hypothetical protein BS50DRAFT_657606 [Corynespora cassiicola Philippines]